VASNGINLSVLSRPNSVAKFQILRWASIPVGVRARDDLGDVRKHLPDRFQHAVDFVATRTSRTDTTGYLGEWKWETWAERDGSAQEVAEQVVDELTNHYPPRRLTQVKADLIDELGGTQRPRQVGSPISDAQTEMEETTP